MIHHSGSFVLPEDMEYLRTVFQNNYVGCGQFADQLAEALLQLFTRRYCVLTQSGSAATEIALYSLKEKYPDRESVLLSSYVCPSLPSAIIRQGLKPVFLDSQFDSLNLAPCIPSSVDPSKVLALILSNKGGIPDDFELASQLPFPIIQDCAQSLGASWNEKPLPSLGLMSILSFGPTKMITGGTGGALLLDDPGLAAVARRYATDELPVEDYVAQGFTAGYGQKISDINAGLALAQLQRLDFILERRLQIQKCYTAVISRQNDALLPAIPTAAKPCWFRFYFFFHSATLLRGFMQENGVDARNSIAHNFARYSGREEDFPHLARLDPAVVSLPIHPSITNSQMESVAHFLKMGLNRQER